jgi:hypothetical protein
MSRSGSYDGTIVSSLQSFKCLWRDKRTDFPSSGTDDSPENGSTGEMEEGAVFNGLSR